MPHPTSATLGIRPLSHHEVFRSAPSTGDPVELTLVVPAYNEAGRLDEGVDRLLDAAGHGAVDLARTEVLVVDDASTDGTAGRAEQLLGGLPHVRIIRLDRHRGKGGSVRAGFGQARGSEVAFLDADMAILPDQVPRLLTALECADVAIGAREHRDSSVDVGSAVRVLGGRAFNTLVNVVTKVGLEDTQCGFKGFRTAVGRLLLHCSVIDGFAFDVEVLSVARTLGLTVAEVPVDWLRVEGSSIHPLRDPLRMLVDVASVRLGLRRPDPVPALHVKGVAATVAATVLGDRLPVLDLDGTLVLLPLVDQEGYRRAEQVLLEAGGRGPVEIERRSLSVSELQAMAPLKLVTAD